MTAVTHQARSNTARPRPLAVRRSSLLALPGLLVGYLWLAPVFVLPGATPLYDRGFALERFLRVLSVMLLVPLVAARLPGMVRRERVLRNVVIAFVALPLLSVLNFPDAEHLVATVGPYLVGGVSLLCLAALRPAEFSRWLQGVGFAALAFVLVGAARYGLDTTTYYGRPRVHLGFVHPTQTASALCAAALYVATLLTARSPLGFVRRVVLLVLVAGSAVLLILISSRNTFLLLFLALIFAGATRLVGGWVPRLGGILVILGLFPAIMLYATWGDTADATWQLANLVSSGRLLIYRDLLAGLAREDAFSLLFGPTNTVREVKAVLSGFAASDSAYLTVLLNYGLITTAAFYVFWLLLAWRLVRRGTPLEYGTFCAIAFYLLLDAQGLTPSNVLVFALLAWCVRASLSGRPRPPARTSPAAHTV